jgi:predicted ArsR family transcriptional regulator
MQSTRQEILDILRAERQGTVDDLAQRLELTPMTIRHHLNVLQAQNLVEASRVQRSQRVGRPRLVYTLTEEAEELFPQSYGELARHLVSEVKETMGPEGTRAIFERIADKIAAEAPPPAEGQTFEERLDQVAEFLEPKGFLFTWEQQDGQYLLKNVNCPYRRVAEDHAEVCALDAMLIERLLGIKPKYLSLMQAGADTCTCLLAAPEGSRKG